MNFLNLKKTDPVLYELVKKEIERQRKTINLIPSENFVSPAVLEVLGSPLTNKYSEGYPGRRYYPGNEYYDGIEKLAQTRALKLFGLSSKKWSVNVQSYSGSPANLEIYAALMKPGDILMGMSVASGGHLTHGHPVNFSGRLFRAVQYGVDFKTGLLDYGAIEKMALKFRPQMIVSGFTAYPRRIDFAQFGRIAKKIGAYHLADISHISGLIAAGLHPSPFPHSDVVMTTTQKTLRGPRGALIFSKKEISERIDRAVFPGMQGGPHNNVIAAIALTLKEASRPSFKKYQKQVVKNAGVLAEELKKRGFKLATGGTDNHLMLLDLSGSGLNGTQAEKMLEKAGILANRNSLPLDAKPFNPSGLRLGTPAVTSRGMKEKEMKIIADLIYKALFNLTTCGACNIKKN